MEDAGDEVLREKRRVAAQR
jgi:hypothetical protein